MTTKSEEAQADGAFGGRLLGDPADKDATKARRHGGWTVEEWLAWLERHPDGCLPSGVGWAIVETLREGS